MERQATQAAQEFDMTDCFRDVQHFEELITSPKQPDIKLSIPALIYMSYHVSLEFIEELPFVETLTVDFRTHTFKINDPGCDWFETLCYNIFRQLIKLNVFLLLILQ